MMWLTYIQSEQLFSPEKISESYNKHLLSYI